ncbi:MAG: hypothetical protein KDD64_14550, partial [Bdellovibrionales bacterium]|nr:hypothetical protein [Bdellovibrionales bacterium]
LSGFKDAGEYLKEIGKSGSKIFNDPIKGFGVLGGYATRKFTQLTSLGRDRVSFVPEPLESHARIFEEYTLDFARAVEGILRKHGKHIIGKQFTSKRIADTAIDLFTGLCLLSRVSQIVESVGEEKAKHEIEIATIFSHQAKRRMKENLRRIDKNEDDSRRSLADYIVESGDFPWDTLPK